MSKITVFSTDGNGKPRTISVQTGATYGEVLSQLTGLSGETVITINEANGSSVSGTPSEIGTRPVPEGAHQVVASPRNQTGN